MTVIITVLIIITILFCLFLFLVAPHNKEIGAIHNFEQQYIAHRGLYDNDSEAPENSLLAFSKAIEKNYGIELDVQLTSDKKLVVFHDESLKRMCGVDKKVSDCSYEELQQYTLGVSDEHIPLFDDVLKLIDGKTPVIVEIKVIDEWKETTVKTAQRLDTYKGLYCIESFHPLAVYWFKKNRPSVIRGQLSTDFYKDKVQLSHIKKILLTNLLLNFLSRPDFIAFNFNHVNSFCYSVCRRFFKVTNAAWTIRSQDELDKAKDVFTIIIFERFEPV